jgi:hypothetical protein
MMMMILMSMMIIMTNMRMCITYENENSYNLLQMSRLFTASSVGINPETFQDGLLPTEGHHRIKDSDYHSCYERIKISEIM